MEKLYYRLCKGMNSKGKLYAIEDNMYNHIDDYEKDWYFSTYLYTEEQRREIETEIEEVDKQGNKYTTIRGVSGITDVKTNKMCFDFDSHDNLELARKDTLKLVDKLIGEGIPKKDIQLCYSGSKGFGVIIETDTYFTPEEIKRTASFLTTDSETFDSKMYNASRIFRCPLTKHPVSGLYKYPLTYTELKDKHANEIKELAKSNDIDPLDYQDYFDVVQLPEKIVHLKNIKPKVSVSEVDRLEMVTKLDDINFSERPSFLTPAKYMLHLGHFQEGQRSHSAMILCSTYKKAGFSKTDSYRLLKSVMERQSEINNVDRFPDEELWNNVVSVVYGSNWNGGTYNSDTSDLLVKTNLLLPEYLRDTNKGSGLVDNDYIFGQFKKFMDEIDKNTLRFGIKDLDNKVKLLTGTTVGVLGIPSSGKTALGMSLLANNSKVGEQSIFYSLDMSINIIAYRQVQAITGWDDDMIKNTYKTNPKLFFDKYNESKETLFKNVTYCFRHGTTPADIRSDIVNYEQNTGKKVRLVLIDYLENVQSGYTDPTIGSGVVAQSLSNIAAELNVLIVILLQTQKNIQPTEEITSMRSIKGASIIEQSLSVAIGISRLGHSSTYSDYDTSMQVNVIKNRFGSQSRVDVGWSGNYAKIRDLTQEDRKNISEIIRLKKEDAEEREEERRQNRGNGWG
ncbi:MAG TPA: DnaB-like helicase C-terminal domain-containing protein [Patescibacteria group bacterium]|nr:MAG: hypothetical protein UR43_C0005G0127 [candidate division TM6 bacterium GW2011_GWF2_33_332]HLD91224.1 DnaB-like helicase C-terminal domain-containing protein [Patescibacteria group bacterium]